MKQESKSDKIKRELRSAAVGLTAVVIGACSKATPPNYECTEAAYNQEYKHQVTIEAQLDKAPTGNAECLTCRIFDLDGNGTADEAFLLPGESYQNHFNRILTGDAKILKHFVSPTTTEPLVKGMETWMSENDQEYFNQVLRNCLEGREYIRTQMNNQKH